MVAALGHATVCWSLPCLQYECNFPLACCLQICVLLPTHTHPPFSLPDWPYSTVSSGRLPSSVCRKRSTAAMSASVCEAAGLPVLQPYLSSNGQVEQAAMHQVQGQGAAAQEAPLMPAKGVGSAARI